MKKVIAIILTLAVCLSLAACGDQNEEKAGSEEASLTADNIEQYLKFSSKVEECNFQEGAFVKAGPDAKGNAKILVETINTSGAEFKNVTITCQVWAAGGLWCGWEFDKGNVRCEEAHKEEYNYKEITITLSHDGKATVNEELKWVNYEDTGAWSEGKLAVYDELTEDDIEIKIINVTGKVVEGN